MSVSVLNVAENRKIDSNIWLSKWLFRMKSTPSIGIDNVCFLSQLPLAVAFIPPPILRYYGAYSGSLSALCSFGYSCVCMRAAVRNDFLTWIKIQQIRFFLVRKQQCRITLTMRRTHFLSPLCFHPHLSSLLLLLFILSFSILSSSKWFFTHHPKFVQDFRQLFIII